MDSYAIARAESRIDQLEQEVRELKFDAERRKWERPRPGIMEEFVWPQLWFISCAMAGLGIGLIIIKIIQRLFG